MKKRIAAILTGAALLIGGAFTNAEATPSTTYWTPAVSDVQPYGVWHIGIDNYFTIGRKATASALPTDVGLTVGALPYDKLQLELGVDLMGHSTDPLMFNGKLGSPEGKLFDGSPAINFGVFNVGTDSKDAAVDGDGRTDYNIIDVVVGKTLPLDLGRVHAGVYSGNKKILVDKNGKKENTGFMIGWDKGFKPTKDKDGNEYSKWIVAADYASGNNAIGGGGIGVYHYFTKDISLLTGPVWFNDSTAVGVNPEAKWVWTTQLDINY
ncbi:MAG: hypothetical protein HY887_07095 [Deltaproteobacteria bacterium]|nr:hypothetical protein [Deltaproteobacteria bacterium]